MIEQVFNRFFRISNPQVQSYPGIGLGLYISAAIIERHGGTIGVKSKEGEGAEFWFALPYKTASDEANNNRR
jgi:signal transduction histidine kinase